MEWKEVRLCDVCSELSDGLHKAPKFIEKGEYIFVNAKNLYNGYILDNDPTKKTSHEEYLKYKKPLGKHTILYSIDGTIGNIAKYRGEKCVLGKGACYLNCNPKIVVSSYLYYQLQSSHFKSYIHLMSTGSTIKHISLKTMREYVFELPSLTDQRRIASILSSLDRKIELNNKINAKFVDSELGMIPEGWKVGRLTEIASYMNGLAMQKFPPENNEDSLPVLKIKELGQGFCGTDSDRCSCNIKDECRIHNGNVIFSWSGTLLVDVWCGGDCGLNQHLFKVTSKDYPKWFYYYWTKHHLQEFIHIAKDKAVTLGHIKRGHLEEAMVAIPDNDSMEKAHELFEPILSKMISLRLENSRLSLLRDTLLPRLMSGEIEVPQ